jgi:phospholipid/cholesterol/gamma-HCH transport system substrate-binding protein
MSVLQRYSERTLGVAGVVGVALMGVLVALISFVPFGQSHYTAVLEHSAGLRTGEEVQVAGVGSGEVRSITLDGHSVKVDFTLDSDVRLGRDTRAAVKVATLLGSHFLEVEPRGSGSLTDDTIPLAHTSVPFNLQDVIEGSVGELDKLDGVTVAKSLSVLADTLRDTPADAQAAIDGVARLSAAAARRSDQMRQLLEASSNVTTDLAKNSQQIIDLIRQSNLVLAELTKRRDVIHAMLVDSRELAEQITGILDDNEADLRPLMKDFNAALANLKKQEKKVTASIDGLGTMARYFANAAGNGPWIDLHVPVALWDSLGCGTVCAK